MELNIKRLSCMIVMGLVLMCGLFLVQSKAVYADDSYTTITTADELDQAVDGRITTQHLRLGADINTTESMNIEGQITIDLNGHTIDRGINKGADYTINNGEVFEVEYGAKLIIEDSSKGQEGKITGGCSKNGAGGVHIKQGTFILRGGSICSNRSSKGGGAVYLAKSDKSQFIMSGGSLRDNTANSSKGGAINIEYGSVKITGGTISGNYAGENGGAIHVNRNKSSVLSVSNASFSDNYAHDTAGAIDINRGDATIISCTFTNNSAPSAGAIKYNDGDVVISGCSFEKNHSNTDGGAIWCKSGDSLTISNSSFHANYSTLAGYMSAGAIYIDDNNVTLENVTVTENIVRYNRGAIYAGGNNFTLKGKCIIKDNYVGEVGQTRGDSDLVLGGDIFYCPPGGAIEGVSAAEVILTEDLYPGSDINLRLNSPSVNHTIAKMTGTAKAENNVSYFHLTNSGKRAAADGNKIVKKDRGDYEEPESTITSLSKPGITLQVSDDELPKTKISIQNTAESVDGYETIYYRTTVSIPENLDGSIVSPWMEYKGEVNLELQHSTTHTVTVEAYTRYGDVKSEISTAIVTFDDDLEATVKYPDGNLKQPKITATAKYSDARESYYMDVAIANQNEEEGTYTTYCRYKGGESYSTWTDWDKYTGTFPIYGAPDGYTRYVQAYTMSDKYSSDTTMAKVVLKEDGTLIVTDEDGTTEIEAATYDYTMISAGNQEVISGAEVSFVSEAYFSKFTKVQIDGEDIDSENYTAKRYAKTVASRTEVTLSGKYTATLAEGEHTVTIVSDDGEASDKFTVKAGTAYKLTVDPSRLVIPLVSLLMEQGLNLLPS